MTTSTTLPELTGPQFDAILAGLRLLAEHVASGAVHADDGGIGAIWSDDGQHEGLDPGAIHDLADSLNGG